MTSALVIGGGPAGLMAADVLSAAGCSVVLADQMPTVGRKFLMAGKSGLNLTKAEPLEAFLDAYPAAPEVLRDAVADFGPDAVAAWAEGLGQEIFTGSTGRLFPKAMKASPLLRAWLARLDQQGVETRTRWTWTGWEGNALAFQTPDGAQVVSADIVILALGGGSWKRLGSDGAWVKHLDGTKPFQPSNCGFAVAWSPFMAGHFGSPIKATKLTAGSSQSRGEWVITKRGVEGGGVYEVSATLRDGAKLHIDLMPDLSEEDLQKRWEKKRAKASVSNFLKSSLKLAPAKVALVNEVAAKQTPKSAEDWCGLLKSLPIPLEGPLPLDEAISTAGGLGFHALDQSLMIANRPGVFCAGEMLDWDAPTGGYLVTACLALGRKAAKSALGWVRQN